MKYYESEWPEQTHFCPILSEHDLELMKNHNKGVTMARQEMPEAACMFSKNHFRYVHDFLWFNGFMGVTGKFAEILKTVDFGEGGGLVPIPVYEADMQTQLEQEFYMVNWGKHNIDSFVPKQSEAANLVYKVENIGELWDTFVDKDDGIAVDVSAFKGPDIWVEPKLMSVTFMKGWLAHALLEAKIKPDLGLFQCKIVESGV